MESEASAPNVMDDRTISDNLLCLSGAKWSVFTIKGIEKRHYDERIENTTVDPLELLVARRKEDRGNMVWHRFNIVQESMVNGLYHKYDNTGSIRKAKMLTNIDEIVRVNKEISNTFERRVA